MLETGDFAPVITGASDGPCLSKRREHRRRVIHRASIVSVLQAGNVHLTGISPRTVTGISEFALAPQQRVVIDLGVAGHRFVTISACQNGRFTGQFENPWMRLHPSLNWLAEMGAKSQLPDQPPAQSLIARLSLTGGHAVVAVRNLSSAGAMIEASLPFVPGQLLLFSLTYGEPVLAEIRWVDNGRAGLQFHGKLERGDGV